MQMCWIRADTCQATAMVLTNLLHGPNLVQRFRHSIQGCLPVRQGSQAFPMNLLSVPVH
jgi:hypothetical protein